MKSNLKYNKILVGCDKCNIDVVPITIKASITEGAYAHYCPKCLKYINSTKGYTPVLEMGDYKGIPISEFDTEEMFGHLRGVKYLYKSKIPPKMPKNFRGPGYIFPPMRHFSCEKVKAKVRNAINLKLKQ